MCSTTNTRAIDTTRQRAADLAAIDQLHAADMRAVLAGDTTTLMSLWTDDIVSLAPNAPIRNGRAENAAFLRQSMAASRDIEPLEYRLELRDVELFGDHALEWGTYHGRSRMKTDGRVFAISGTVMRFLRKEPDGRWRVARTAFTTD